MVWWDPKTLKLTPPANLGLRQEAILKGGSDGQEAASVLAYREWQIERANTSAAGQTKEFDLFTATEAAGAPAGISMQVHLETIEKRSGRAAGARFGTLVHTILRDAALDGQDVDQLSKVHGRILGATAQEIADAVQAAASALRHPLLERARKSKSCKRELPILLKLDGNRVLEGIIDLAFEENGTWHVVDFKTDVEIGPNRGAYENQLRWYCFALARLNKAPVEAHLLAV